MFTFHYSDRSWADALKYGFLSANVDGSGNRIYNIQVGDRLYCEIAGKGFIGIGECPATAVHMDEFLLETASGMIPVGGGSISALIPALLVMRLPKKPSVLI